MSETQSSRGHGRAAMRWLLAGFYATAGIAHLWVPEKLLLIMPSWVPAPTAVILLTGVFELVASTALVTRPLRWWAGVALALYALGVWPANFKHAFDGIEMPVIGNSWWYHGPRLALQPVIIWATLYATGVIDWPGADRGVPTRSEQTRPVMSANVFSAPAPTVSIRQTGERM